MEIFAIILMTSACLVSGQRPFFAGSRPIGIPELANKTTETSGGLGDRFGEGDSTTQRLPIEANGDRDLVDRLSKLPIDQQPFWFINWQALEEHRKHPQTYPQRPSQFAEPGFTNPNTNTLNNRFSGTPNWGTPNTNLNFNSGNNQQKTNPNIHTGSVSSSLGANSGFNQNSNNNGNTKLPAANSNSNQVPETNSQLEKTESRLGLETGGNQTTNVNSGEKPINDTYKEGSNSLLICKINVQSTPHSTDRPLADINDENEFN